MNTVLTVFQDAHIFLICCNLLIHFTPVETYYFQICVPTHNPTNTAKKLKHDHRFVFSICKMQLSFNSLLLFCNYLKFLFASVHRTKFPICSKVSIISFIKKTPQFCLWELRKFNFKFTVKWIRTFTSLWNMTLK